MKNIIVSSALTLILSVSGVAHAQYGGGGNGPIVGGNGGPIGSFLQMGVSSNDALVISRQGTTGTTGIVAGASTFKFNINMRVGSRITPDVTELQKVLIAKGKLAITTPTGVFGTKTLAAVKAYQAANGVPTTGYVGPLTRAKLNAGL